LQSYPDREPRTPAGWLAFIPSSASVNSPVRGGRGFPRATRVSMDASCSGLGLGHALCSFSTSKCQASRITEVVFSFPSINLPYKCPIRDEAPLTTYSILQPCTNENEPPPMEHRRACRPCRVRKVKCSKEFPKCLNCRNCGEPCVYPSTVLKPGPKRGSVHKRRRYYPPDMPWEESELRPSTTASIVRPDSPSSENLLPLSAPSPPQPAASPEDNLAYSEHLQVVADLCQPTHAEPSSQGPDPSLTVGSGTEDVLSQTCRELEVSQDRMAQMSAKTETMP
jgi:hypothetical protein